MAEDVIKAMTEIWSEGNSRSSNMISQATCLQTRRLKLFSTTQHFLMKSYFRVEILFQEQAHSIFLIFPSFQNY
jgi:hypothetical protein